MSMDEIIKNVSVAMDQLINVDHWLLEKDLSERSIAHRLAIYLEGRFPEYHVDCEYNGDIDRGDGRKKIMLLRDDLKAKGFLRENEGEEEYVQRSVYPDIIVHQRGTNADNLLIIEIKKSTSSVKDEYDRLKVVAYTSARTDEDLLRYQWGLVLEIGTGEEFPKRWWYLYQEGKMVAKG